MPRPGVGNPGNRGGQKGRSGNKSILRQFEEKDFLINAWTGKIDPKENERIIASGKYGGKHVWLKKLFEGNDLVVNKLFERIHPPPLEPEKPYTVVVFNAYGDQTGTVGAGHVAGKTLAAGGALFPSQVQDRRSASAVWENKHVSDRASTASSQK